MLTICLVFLPFAAALFSYGIGRKSEKIRDSFTIWFTSAELLLSIVLLFYLPSGEIPGVFFGGLHFTTDGFRAVYSVVTSIMWAGTTAFSKEYFAHEREGLNGYFFFVLLTLGATQGVMLSADLMTTFVFFEILSFTSFTWVIHEQTAEAIRAAMTYLFIAVIGGLMVFMGLLILYYEVGTLTFSALPEALTRAGGENRAIFAAGVLILFGFGAKAGMFPLHIWLPKAHPVAPAPSSALLSGILTKVGVYGILMTTLQIFLKDVTYGILVLTLGVITMVLGAVLALFSVNLKRTLACSSMSQIGFILTGIGMTVLLSAGGDAEGAGVALCGAVLHMVNHSLLKLVLFLAAGVVAMNLHALTLDEIRGYGRNKTFLKLAFALGGLGISGVPLFNGYISKTLLHEGIAAGVAVYSSAAIWLRLTEWSFLIAGGFTFAYMLKLFVTIFVEKHPTRQAEYDRMKPCMTPVSTAVVFGSSLFMVILGQPFVMTRLASYMTGNEDILNFSAFTWGNLSGSLISLAIGAAVYLLFVRKVLICRNSYVNLWPEKLDLEDVVYRPVLLRFLPFVFGNIAAVFGENKILKLCARGAMSLGQKIAMLFGENLILKPLARAVMVITGFISRLFMVSMDGLIVLLRKTLLREKKVRDGHVEHFGKFRTFAEATREAAEPVFANFSFALMMTCIGIVLVLVFLLISALR